MVEIYPEGENPPPPTDDVNQEAYLRLKAEIDERYPKDWYVGIDDGRVVADAKTFTGVCDALEAQGFVTSNVLVVQSGEDSGFLWIL